MPSPSRPAKRRFDPLSACVLVAFAIGYAITTAIRAVPAWVHLLYAGASLLCLAFYAVDKYAARAGRDRIPESTLLALGLVGGWPGAIVAQQLFRHKTVKRLFRLRFWCCVGANLAVFAWATAQMLRSMP